MKALLVFTVSIFPTEYLQTPREIQGRLCVVDILSNMKTRGNMLLLSAVLSVLLVAVGYTGTISIEKVPRIWK